MARIDQPTAICSQTKERIKPSNKHKDLLMNTVLQAEKTRDMKLFSKKKNGKIK